MVSTASLIAHNGASKRSKSETRVVGRPKSEKALKRALCANLKNACDALSEAAFEVRPHPYLEGVKCRSDGAVLIPANGNSKAHWTHGCTMVSGYKEVVIRRQHHYVHRLILEAFAGPCPGGKPETDHINRDRADNRVENLRWVSVVENRRNRASSDERFLKYGVHTYDDKKAYNRIRHRAKYRNNPEFRKREIRSVASYNRRKAKEAKEAKKMTEDQDGRR